MGSYVKKIPEEISTLITRFQAIDFSFFHCLIFLSWKINAKKGQLYFFMQHNTVF